MSFSLRHKLVDRIGRLDYASALRNAMRMLSKHNPNLSRRGLRLRAGEMSDDELMSNLLGAPVHFLSNTAFKLGPLALTTTLTTNIFNPGTTTGGVACTSAPFDKLYVMFTRFGIVNKHASIAATASLFIGATGANAAGSEFIWSATAVAVGFYDSRPCRKRFGQADFLVGGSNTATALTLDGDGEIGIGA